MEIILHGLWAVVFDNLFCVTQALELYFIDDIDWHLLAFSPHMAVF